jgi:VanZ family protein
VSIRPSNCGAGPQAAILTVMLPRQRCARLIVLAAWMALITYWSGQGNLPIDQPDVQNAVHGLQHRFAHLIAFGLVGLLARWAFDGLPKSAWLAILLTSLFGATDEWHQTFTAGRRPGLDDWAFDTGAAALAIYVWAGLRTTRWRAVLRPLAPLAVGVVFVVGIGLAIRPTTPLRSAFPNLNRAALHNVGSQAATSAIEFARNTRAVARQIRSTVAG